MMDELQVIVSTDNRELCNYGMNWEWKTKGNNLWETLEELTEQDKRDLMLDPMAYVHMLI